MMIVEGRVYPDNLVALPGSELNKTAAFSSLQRIGGGALRRKMSVYGARFRSAAEAGAQRAGRMARENRGYLAGSFEPELWVMQAPPRPTFLSELFLGCARAGVLMRC